MNHSIIETNPRVLLVNPPFSIPKEVSTPSLSLGYLASVLEDHKIQVSILDMAVQTRPWTTLKNRLTNEKPSIVGITSVSCNFNAAMRVGRIVKAIDQKTMTILGGVHATFMGHSIIKDHKEVDIVVKGEGEKTLVQLVEAREGKKLVQDIHGIFYRQSNQVKENTNRKMIENLDSIPFPARHLFDLEKYTKNYTNILASRGCTYSCIFCSNSNLWDNKIRYRQAQNIIKEIQEIKQFFGYDRIYFEDDIFTLNKNLVTKLCHEIIENNLDIEWACNTRVDLINSNIAHLMARAGCSVVSFGVESGCQETLVNSKKGITLSQIRKAAEIVKKEKMDLRLSFIVGLPGESRTDFEKTLDLAKELNPEIIAFNGLIPFPGTEIFGEAKQYGISLVTSKLDKYHFTHKPIIETNELSNKDISDLIRKGINTFKSEGYQAPTYEREE